MRLPEFTAEASLGNVSKQYELASGPAGETGNLVQPQSYSIQRYGNFSVITVCDPVAGCVQIQVPGGIAHRQI